MLPDSWRRSLPYRIARRIRRTLTPAAGPHAPVAAPRPGFHWSDDGMQVWVETPEPPHNLLNALYNNSYFTLIDHCARGRGTHMTPEGLRNHIIENERIVYVRDDNTGEFFAVPWLPVAHPPQNWRAVAEPGSQLIENTSLGLHVSWRIFVPAGADPVEIWNVHVRNVSGRPRRVSLFTYVSMKCDGYDLYSGEMFRIAQYDPKLQAIHVRTDAEQHETVDFPWHNGFMTADAEPTGWDASPGAFIGGGGRTLRDPRAVVEGRMGASRSPMWPPIAALHHQLTVPAGGDAAVRYLVGACDHAAMVRDLRARYLVPWRDHDAHLETTRSAIERMSAPVRLQTPDPDVDRMLNVWVKVQCHYGLYWGRWGFCGYRDQLQQAIGCLPQTPALARERILAACRHQFASGFALRGWRPIDDHRYVDSASWLIPATNEYIRETGDWSLLDEEAPYFDGGSGTVFEHLERALRRLHDDRGAHGLCLLFGGDWNDSLTGPCRNGRGESVWMSMAFCRAAAQLGELARRTGRASLADELDTWRAEMADAINRHAWDGEWYLCALDDDGRPVGSRQNDEGRIFLNMQSWSLLAGVATEERWRSAWAAVRRHLDTGWGYMLNWPAYTRVHRNVGRLSYIRPGAGENASVYTHGNAFLFLSLLEQGLADEALGVWRAIHPANPARPGAAMPNVFYNGFYGPDSEIMPGLADHAWTTGSAAWMLYGVQELMLGLRRTFDGLVVRPRLPASWPTARIRRVYRGATYVVEIHNRHGIAAAAVDSVTFDGRPHDPQQPLPVEPGEHRVVVELADRPGLFRSLQD